MPTQTPDSRPAGTNRPGVSWFRGYDPLTLGELVDPVAAARRLRDLGDGPGSTPERVVLLRVLGRLDEALSVAGAEVHEAKTQGDDARLAAAQLRLGQVHQSRGETATALLWIGQSRRLAGRCGDHALEAFGWLHEGRLRFAAEDFVDAGRCFRSAADCRAALTVTPAQLGTIDTALRAVTEHLPEE